MEWIGAWIVAAGTLVVVGLVLSMLLYEQLMVALAWLLHAIFALGLLAAGSSLALGGAYRWAASELVERSGVPAQIREVDSWMQTLRELPDTVWERLRHPFGGDAELTPTAIPLALPQPPGPLESRIVPTLHGSLAALLRVLAFLSGTVLMVVGLAYRSVTDLILQLRALRRRVADLESKLDADR